MDKFELKKKQDIIFLGFNKRQQYYDYINEEIKASPNLCGEIGRASCRERVSSPV